MNTLALSSELQIKCAGKDSNLRSPKATDLQSVVFDHSTTDASCYSNKFTAILTTWNGYHIYNPELYEKYLAQRHELALIEDEGVLIDLVDELPGFAQGLLKKYGEDVSGI